ncbi:23S rRNA methylase [Thioploca ingrica]|uniref:Ribosomal RNA large subunit methyltransferase E n=1 Tax=Thioploca ingrica TaxID=40754 RepID=A0A090AQJ5_9GAMM|nr:23S rRNA methylase [Thioploca ingrica]
MSKNHHTNSSQRWLQEYHTDKYVKQAKHAGYRSRAVYKLAQIDARDHLFHPGMMVIDLGAAPGGWSQWVQQRLHHQVKLIAIDILPMEPLPGLTFIQGDFQESKIIDELRSYLGEQTVDLVMSDMAPNISGIKAIDQPRAMLLAELARDLALEVLVEQGHFLSKIFQGEGFDAYLKVLKSHFRKVVIRKPDASRARSAEIYVLASGYQPQNRVKELSY